MAASQVINMADIKVKKGDTLYLQCRVHIDEVLQSISDWEIKSAVKFGPRVIDNLSITKSSDYFTMQSPTDGWPIGKLQCDIQYTTNNDVIISTETFIIDVIRDVTK